MNKLTHFTLNIIFWGLCTTVAGGAEVVPAVDLTLKQAYQLALERSETIAIDQEAIKETEGKFFQALSTALPQVAWGASAKWQDRSADNATRRYTPASQFSLTQPLFSGFKEFAAIAASRAEHRQYQAALERAKQMLFVDVSDAFYFLKSYQEELAVLQATNDALLQRQTELKRRQSLGRSRSSEVANIESRFYQNQAQIENLKAQEAVAFQWIGFLVGREVVSLKDQDVVINELGEVVGYLGKADTRSDVKAAYEASTVSRKKVVVAKAGYWPTVNVAGNSYTKRVGALADVDWDVTLNVDVPIFNSGLTQGNVMQAEAVAKADQLRYEQTKRRAILDIHDAYITLISDQKRTQAFAQAVQAAQKNYDLQVGDYGNNLVNNLDVLQALEDLQSVKSDYVSVRNETQRAFWAFKAAIGDLGDDAL